MINLKKYMIVVAAVLTSALAYSQIAVVNETDATILANTLIGSGSGVTIVSATFTGSSVSSGTFSGGDFGITEGILLTSGSAQIAVGPNTSGGAGYNSGQPGDADLNAIIPSNYTRDAAVLEITFIPNAASVEFTYVFASEEYNEYVCSQFNDVFAFFVNGGTYSNQNIALIPGTTPPMPVSINNVNDGTHIINSFCGAAQLSNSAYYIYNLGGTNIEYDGYTVPLSAVINVVPGTEYTIKLAIADVGDGILDSGVFLKGQSFVAVTCDAGEIAFANSDDDSLELCIDNLPSVINLSNTGDGTNDTYKYIVTDTIGSILSVNGSNGLITEGWAVGIYNIYGISYSGNLVGAGEGGNIDNISADGCFDMDGPLTIDIDECEEVFDCPLQGANFGDACDDGNPNTENDIIGDDCVCAGTLIPPVFDCPEVSQNYGDACNDGDPLTENDVRQGDCSCAGTLIPPVFDCPEVSQNFGDACNDDDPLTENDIRQDDCSCAGTLIPPVFDCPEVSQNYGDACNDGDASTGNDIRQNDCSCAGTPIVPSTCENFVYFLSDHSAADGVSDIYKVTLSGGVADLDFIVKSDIEVHIAYNPIDNLIYAVSKHTNSYRTLNPYAASPAFGPTVDLGADYGELTAAVFNADGKLLIGSQNHNAIYSVNVTTDPVVVSTYDTSAPVTGGDLAFGSDGMLYLATRTGNGLYTVWPADVMADQFIGSVPNNVTGLAITDMDQLIMSSKGNTNLELRNSDGSNPGVSYAVMLNGAPYTLRDGDMASGCDSHSDLIDNCGYKLYYVHGPAGGGNRPLLEVTLNSDGTASYNALIANIGGHIGLSPDGSTIYNITGIGTTLSVIDVATASVVSTATIVTTDGSNPLRFPACVVGSDGTLYIGSNTTNQVYTVDPITGVAIPYGPSRSVNGGDLIEVNGEIWVVTRNNKTFTNVMTGDSFTVPVTQINGAAVLENGNVIVSDGNGGSLFKEIDFSTHEVVRTYDIGLPLFDGDLAGGCTKSSNVVDIPGECNATTVVEYIQGTSHSGGSIAANRTDASRALGAPERTDANVFVSLGYGGSLTLSFNGSIPNGPGDDIEVVETSFGHPSCTSYPEFADVYVSVDGVNFAFAKTICRTDGFVDISDAGAFTYVNYVRIVNNDALSTTPDAFDVDGVVAIHNCVVAPRPAYSDSDAMTTLSSYPNPTTGDSQVIFSTPTSGKATVAVYDMNGRMVKAIFDQNVDANQEYRLGFDGSALPNGVYIYKLTTNEGVKIEKFMIAH